MLDIRIIAGRLTRDPEVKEVAQDLKVARFTVAVDGDFKDKDGNKKTEFVDCEAWRATADFVENYLKKGRLVNVTGRPKTEEWEDNKFQDDQGNPVLRRKTVLTVEKIYPMDKADDTAGGGDEGGQAAPRNNNRPSGNRGGSNRPASGGNRPASNPAGASGGRLPQW